jgi:signal transduction histidine kinase
VEEWDKIRAENIRKKGMQHHFETKMLKKNGTLVDVDISLSIIRNKNGEIIGSVGVFSDISLRIEIEKKLDKAYMELLQINRNLEYKVIERTREIKKLLKQKDDFIHQLGHDLKTPLTPLNALLPVVFEKIEDSELKEFLNISIQNVEYIKNLVDKTLKLAAMNSNSFELDIEIINPRDIVNRVIRNRIDSVNQKNIRVENHIDNDIRINADRLRFEELVDNIISNSLKFTNENGLISIYSESVNKKVRFSVRDNGIGMTFDQYEKIFVEFYKADKSRHEIKSSGLGLSICKRIVEKHGGEIWVESPGLGKGSVFYFTFQSA